MHMLTPGSRDCFGLEWRACRALPNWSVSDAQCAFPPLACYGVSGSLLGTTLNEPVLAGWPNVWSSEVVKVRVRCLCWLVGPECGLRSCGGVLRA